MSMRLETPFQRVDQVRDRHLRWIANQQVDMLVLAMHLRQLRFKVGANLRKQQPQAVEGVSVEDPVSILSDKDQVDLQCRNTMSATIKFFTDPHRPSILRPC